MSIQQIIDLNNAGVSQLASGDASTCVKALKSAIVTMRTIEETIGMDVDMDPTKDSACPTVKIANMEDPCFYIYNRALLLEASTDMPSVNITILFNMALTYHQRGLAKCELANLQKAVRLYELAIQLADAIGPKSGFVAMAALNNQASIYFCMANYDAAREHLERISEAAAVLLSPEQSALSRADQNAMEEIFLNVAIMQPPTAAASA